MLRLLFEHEPSDHVLLCVVICRSFPLKYSMCQYGIRSIQDSEGLILSTDEDVIVVVLTQRTQRRKRKEDGLKPRLGMGCNARMFFHGREIPEQGVARTSKTIEFSAALRDWR